MGIETLRKAADFALSIGLANNFRVSWHAGEPLTVPIHWYQDAHHVLTEAFGDVLVGFDFQTNGTLLTDKWIQFVRSDSRIDIGVSVDGPAHIHDMHRQTRRSLPTHSRTMKGIQRLKDAGIPFGVIAVLTNETLDHPDEFYDFFAELQPTEVGLNTEELEGAHRRSSLHTNIDRFRRFIARLAERTLEDDAIQVREFEYLKAVLASQHVPQNPSYASNQQNVPWRILSVDVRGGFHTYSPELLGHPLPDIGGSLGNVHSCSSWEHAAMEPTFINIDTQIQKGVSLCLDTCEYFRLCGGGPPSNKWFENQTFESTETTYCVLKVKIITDEYLAAIDRAYKMRS